MKVIIELGDDFQKGVCLKCPFATFNNADFNPQCIFGYFWGKCDLKIIDDETYVNIVRTRGEK